VYKAVKLVLVIGSNRRVPVTLDQFSIGSQHDNDFVISDPTISRHHALIVRHGQTFQLHDLNSTNGTFVDGVHVARPVILHNQHSIRFGTVRAQALFFEDARFWQRKLPPVVPWALLVLVIASAGIFVIRAARNADHVVKEINNVPKSEVGGEIPTTVPEPTSGSAAESSDTPQISKPVKQTEVMSYLDGIRTRSKEFRNDLLTLDYVRTYPGGLDLAAWDYDTNAIRKLVADAKATKPPAGWAEWNTQYLATLDLYLKAIHLMDAGVRGHTDDPSWVNDTAEMVTQANAKYGELLNSIQQRLYSTDSANK
jgi:hypothetical protein